MIGVDISGIWCRLTLPEVLGDERAIFDAHMELAGGEYRQSGCYGWLRQADSTRRELLEGIRDAAAKLRTSSSSIVVLGTGLPVAGVKAAVRLARGRRATTPRLIFAGDNCSPDDWDDVLAALNGGDFSVLAISPTGNELPPLIALRSLRWILEKRYGDAMKERVILAAPAGANAMAALADAEGYTFCETPEEPGGAVSALQPAALLLLAAAGHNPDLLWEGANAQYEACDDRSMENPAWLYAAARTALGKKHYAHELLCVPSPAAAELGQWWSRVATSFCCKGGAGAWATPVRVPEDLFTLGDGLLDGGQRQFATLLRLPRSLKNTAVEMTWKDPDKLGALTGVELSTVEETTLDRLLQSFGEADVPAITVQCEEDMTDDKLGELLYFAEFSAALAAKASGLDPFALPQTRGFLRGLDSALGRT
ncbi:MAG: hypothetical protein IJT18_06060 [Oscillospiraceae bacterium]|nr:hypothetical protein [Oscillospiraceae bacterium]